MTEEVGVLFRQKVEQALRAISLEGHKIVVDDDHGGNTVFVRAEGVKGLFCYVVFAHVPESETLPDYNGPDSDSWF